MAGSYAFAFATATWWIRGSTTCWYRRLRWSRSWRAPDGGSSRGEFYLTSDAATPTWIRWKRTSHLIPHISESERERFDTVTYQMGGMMLFPGKQIEGKPTINQERAGRKVLCSRASLRCIG